MQASAVPAAKAGCSVHADTFWQFRDDGAASAPSMRQEVAALRRHTGMFMPPAGIAPQAAEWLCAKSIGKRSAALLGEDGGAKQVGQ
jgi:hypothetical protein